MRMKLTAIAACALLLGGCANNPLPVGVEASAAQAYTLGAGDKLRITTFGFKDLSGDFSVGADGSVALPLLGPVAVHGLTADQLERRLTELLAARDLVNHPNVVAEVIEYRPYYILGEVTKPGQYAFTNGLTALKAVATAQGFTYRANARTIFITPDTSNREQTVRMTASTPIRPGDTIRVGQRYF
jgi:polysaccharide export outer membrane protein